jgi:hypothetical protein
VSIFCFYHLLTGRLEADILTAGLAKISEILAGTNVYVDANISSLSSMASLYNQAGTVREEFHPHKLASSL